MKRNLAKLMLSFWLVSALPAVTRAQEGVDPETFRTNYLAFVDELATLPYMTTPLQVDPQAAPHVQAQQRTLMLMRADAERQLQDAQQAVSGFSAEQLASLQADLAVANWQDIPRQLRAAFQPEGLTNLAFPDSCFGSVAAAQATKITATAVAVIAHLVCRSNQCSGAAGSVPACVVEGVARGTSLAATIAYQQILRCHRVEFENEAQNRLGVTVSSRATEDSVGVRNDCDTTMGRCVRSPGTSCVDNDDCNVCLSGTCLGSPRSCTTGVDCRDNYCNPTVNTCNGDPTITCTTDADCPRRPFASLNLHDKLETRLDVQTSTRSTQDSVDGQREAPAPPSNEKSVRTVVDKTDEIVLPRLQRKMDELNAAIAAQGSLLRDLNQLQIRFKISENLIQRHPRVLPIALFQLPNGVAAPAKKFCSVSNTKSCATNADCPAAVVGEDCGPATPPRSCSVSGKPCTDFFDCPIQPKPAEQCLPQLNPQTGLLQTARDIVQEAIDMTSDANQRVGSSQIRATRGVVDIEAENYKQAYRHLRQSYRAAIKPFPMVP